MDDVWAGFDTMQTPLQLHLSANQLEKPGNGKEQVQMLQIDSVLGRTQYICTCTVL